MAGPCEDAASMLVNKLSEGMKAPLKDEIAEEIKNNFISKFKSLKEKFFEEQLPNITEVQSEIKTVTETIGRDSINDGVSLLLYYAASEGLDKKQIEGVLAYYAENERDSFAKHIKEAKAGSRKDDLNIFSAAMTYESRITNQTFSAFKNSIYGYSSKRKKGEGTDVLHQAGSR